MEWRSPAAGRGWPHPSFITSFVLILAVLAAIQPSVAGQGLLAALQQASAAKKGPQAAEAQPAVKASAATTPSSSTPTPSPAVPETPVGESEEMQKVLRRWRLSPAEAERISAPHLAGKMSVCISPYTPDVFCNDTEPPETYNGYGLQIFQAIAQRTPWLRDFGSWSYRCMPWDDMIDSISAPNTTDCILTLLVQPEPENKFLPSRPINQNGLMILTRRGQALKSTGLFTPFGAFSWDLWLLLFGSAFLVGGVLWLYDVLDKAVIATGKDEEKGRRPLAPADGGRPKISRVCADVEAADQDGGKPRRRLAGLREGSNDLNRELDKDLEAGGDGKGKAGFASMCLGGRGAGKDSAGAQQPQMAGKAGVSVEGVHKRPGRRWLRMLFVKHDEEKEALQELNLNLRSTLLHMTNSHEPPTGSSLPAHIVLWAWGLLVMIVLSLYTGTTAAIMTTRSLTEGINSRADLAGKAVGTWTDYLEKLAKDGIPAIGYKWDVVEDEVGMLDALLTGKVSAFVLDANFVEYVAGHNCSFSAVPERFLLNDVGLGMHNEFPLPLVNELNNAIIKVIGAGINEELLSTLVTNFGGPCSVRASDVSPSSQLQVQQVLGLWVILALAMMVGAAVLGLKWFRIRAAKKLKAKQALALARTLSRSFSFNKASPRRSASWDRAANVARTSSNFGRLGSFGRVVAAATATAAAPSGSDTPAGSGERSEQGDGGDKGRSPFANAQ